MTITPTRALPDGIAENRARWRNWGRSVEARPEFVARPTTVEQVADTIRFARERDLRVKALGAGHSFTPIAVAPGIQVDVSALSGVRAVAGDLVTLGAGTHLYELPALLDPLGLAMQNLGDIDRQTIAGATSTGTHGTGLQFGGLATRIRRATIVQADGQVRVIDGDEIAAYAVGLGALGILVDVTIQCVPRFVLQAVERPQAYEQTLEEWMPRIQSVDHFEFYVWPHTETVLTKSNTRLPADAPRKPNAAARRLDSVISNSGFRATLAFGRTFPKTVPALNRFATKVAGDLEYTDWSQRVFTTKRSVRFREMEYAVPVEAVPSVLREVRRRIDDRGWHVGFPIEVRAAAADDLWLSTASGRTTGYIAAHVEAHLDPTQYFRELEEIMVAHDGRPHWGKMHTRDAEHLGASYPRFDDFVALRDRVDPDGVFANAYLDRVIGAR